VRLRDFAPRYRAAFATCLILASATLVLDQPAASARGGSVDGRNYLVTCLDQVGSSTFKPPLTSTSHKATDKLKIAATLTGCTATPPPGGVPLTITKGVVSGKLTGTSGTSCVSLLSGGGSNLPFTGSLKVKWTTSPKLNSGVTKISVLSAAVGFSGSNDTFTIPGVTHGSVSGSFSAQPSASFSYSVSPDSLSTIVSDCESGSGLSNLPVDAGFVSLGAPPSSIDLTPGSATIPSGQEETFGPPVFHATGNYPGGVSLDITPLASWLSSMPSVVSLGTTEFTGVNISAGTPGTSTISATLGGVTGSTDMTVVPALTIAASLPTAHVGVPYDQFLSATGGITPYVNWGQSGQLTEAGLSLNTATGEITGTPTMSGDFSFDANVSDSLSASLGGPDFVIGGVAFQVDP
jgi:hypothetical protein